MTAPDLLVNKYVAPLHGNDAEYDRTLVEGVNDELDAFLADV